MKKKAPWPFAWALAAAILFFLTQSLLQYFVGRLADRLGSDPSTGLLFQCLPPLGCIALASFLVMKWKSLDLAGSLRFMGLKPISGRQAILGLLLASPVLAGYGLALHSYLGRGISVALFPTWPALLVLLVVSAGFYEELAFRGFLFQYLRSGQSFLLAAAFSSFLWTLSHWGMGFMATGVRVFFPEMVIFLLGLAGAYVFEKSGNAVWSWMIVHLAVDSIGLVNIGNTGFFRAPVDSSLRYLFGGEAVCLLLAFPLAAWFGPGPKRKGR